MYHQIITFSVYCMFWEDGNKYMMSHFSIILWIQDWKMFILFYGFVLLAWDSIFKSMLAWSKISLFVPFHCSSSGSLVDLWFLPWLVSTMHKEEFIEHVIQRGINLSNPLHVLVGCVLKYIESLWLVFNIEHNSKRLYLFWFITLSQGCLNSYFSCPSKSLSMVLLNF